MTERVAVVGGGITGLTAALRLAEGGVDVQLFEAADRLGGKIHASTFAGVDGVDEGADSFLARVPHAAALGRHVGLDLVPPSGASAAVWHHGLHPIPEGLLLGVPSDIVRLGASGLLSWRGKARAALEPLLPRRGQGGDSIGALMRDRFGDEVHERLVDALVGSIYGADTDRFSLAMVPQLAALAGRGRSLLLSARAMRAAAPPSDAPIFLTPTGGVGSLVDAVADRARAAGATLTTSTPVGEVAADGTRWRVDGTPFDAVVLASPARVTAPLLASAAPEVARHLAAMEHAGVTIVTVAVEDWPERLRGRSGYLVPKPVQQTVTAASFGSQKWPHWRRGSQEIVRISLGRDGLPVDHLDDDTLVERAVAETSRHLELDLRPTAVRISRWPAAFPQYRPGHQRWLAAVDGALPPGLVLAGASYRGIGIPACIAQGEAAAASLLAAPSTR